MAPKTPQNKWILDKISVFLEGKEGCTVSVIEYTADGARLLVQDAFGYQYELNIRLTGRVQQSN